MRHLVLCAALAASCRARPAPTPAAGEVVATVNGVALTRDELAAAPPHGASPARDDDALARAIDDELLAQHAHRLGVDRDPAWQRELREAEGRFRAWRRQRLAELAERREVGARGAVPEAEVRAWYEAHASEVRAQVRVAQLLLRDEATALRVAAELRAGARFEDVAARALPHGVDPSTRPWEMGPLRWQQVPTPWREALPRLRVGERSDVLRGPNRRYWIVELLARVDDPAVTYATAREAVAEYLQEERRLGAGTALRARLRREAHVVRGR